MYAVEFETDLVTPFIQIPNFKAVANRRARVILLLGDEESQFDFVTEKEDAIDALLKNPVSFTNAPFFNREEANAR